jgi:hypothetical protein
MLLSDGAFRLYFYLCLQAKRESGCLTISYLEAAHALSKSRRSITTYFEELQGHGVCRTHPAVNQHRSSQIEICDDYWPYTRLENSPPPERQEQYLLQIKSLLAAQACVKCAFGAADQKFAAALLVRDIPLEQIQRAIALGCLRKYATLLKGTDTRAIASFSYFHDLIEEAGDQETAVDYWSYLKLKVKRLESQWIAKAKAADANIASAKVKKETRRH